MISPFKFCFSGKLESVCAHSQMAFSMCVFGVGLGMQSVLCFLTSIHRTCPEHN